MSRWHSGVGRRDLLALAGVGGLLGPAMAVRAETTNGYTLESDHQGIRTFQGVHQGLGAIDMRVFDFAGEAAPANFLIYEIPPGASEGVHHHNLTDPALGPYDEYYYIIAGRGRMIIDNRAVMVGPGDHVHTPLDVAHGIENVASAEPLKVFLTYIDRSPHALPVWR